MSKTNPNHYHAGSTLPVQRSYINGQYHPAAKQRHFSTTHPGNGQKICDVEIAAQPEIDAAVSSASNAYQQWSQTPAAERGAILRRAAGMIRERNDELAQLETLDTGKPFSETSVEDIRSGAEVIEYQGERGKRGKLLPKGYRNVSHLETQP